jgi:putative PIN family toxin of toxin-antitoxin system
MKITVDTNVIISALGWNGPEYKLMKLVFDEKIIMVISTQILEEFIGIARSDKFDFSEEEIDDFTEVLINAGKIIFPDENISKIEEDPQDNRVLECALAGNVKYIITGDSHLLKLNEFNGKEIMNASKFLKEYWLK